ncbi:MAG: deoxyribonuclease IV [Thermaerobacterales bacterium]
MRIGPHLSIAKGFPAAGKAAVSIGADTFQFFSRNPRGGSVRKLGADEIADWLALKEEHGLGPTVCHIPYTVNMAAPVQKTWDFAVMVLENDLPRAHSVGCPFVVSHPGSHTANSDLDRGLERIAEAIDRIRPLMDDLHHRHHDAPYLCLETMSGQGSEIGWRPEHFARLFTRLEHPAWLGLCVDSCHVFAAGFDLRDRGEVERLATEIDHAVGIDRVKVVHVNDSKTPHGSRSDRHACIGAGEIGLDGLINFITHPVFRAQPILLETPVDNMPEDWGGEITVLKEAAAAR